MRNRAAIPEVPRTSGSRDRNVMLCPGHTMQPVFVTVIGIEIDIPA